MASEQQIWDFLQQKTNNAYGTAAIMGNLMAESSLNPRAVTGTKDSDYVSKADSGLIDFANDSHAFGLAQWAFHTRKEALLNFAKSRNASVGDLNIQLEYLVDEMSNKYKTAWSAVVWANNVRDASDAVMLRYEKPANTSEKAKQRRANFAQKFYVLYADTEPADKPVDSRDVINLKLEDKEENKKKVVVKVDKVNVRLGNGTDCFKLFLANAGTTYDWVATAENGWNAVKLPKQVGWISGEFSEVKE